LSETFQMTALCASSEVAMEVSSRAVRLPAIHVQIERDLESTA
jgi:hypothetical protein